MNSINSYFKLLSLITILSWSTISMCGPILVGTKTVTAGQPSRDATDIMAILTNVSTQVNIPIKAAFTPKEKAELIAKEIKGKNIAGINVTIKDDVVTVDGARKIAYADNSMEKGLKLAATPVTGNSTVVTLGYEGALSGLDLANASAVYQTAFGDENFMVSASISFDDLASPTLDALLTAMNNALLSGLSSEPLLQSRLYLDLLNDIITFDFPLTSLSPFIQNFTSDITLSSIQTLEEIPEPSSLLLLYIGFLGLLGGRWLFPDGKSATLPTS